MNLYKKIKNSAVKNINPKYLELISKRGITLSKIPKHSSSVTSDLFLYRIENNWSTFFELLNVNYLIDNDNLKYKIFEVEIIFFNNSGDLVERFEESTGLRLIKTLSLIQGSEFKDQICSHPFLPRKSHIIFADFVTTDAGTGAVHIAPGHGGDDYLAGQAAGLQ